MESLVNQDAMSPELAASIADLVWLTILQSSPLIIVSVVFGCLMLDAAYMLLGAIRLRLARLRKNK